MTLFRKEIVLPVVLRFTLLVTCSFYVTLYFVRLLNSSVLIAEHSGSDLMLLCTEVYAVLLLSQRFVDVGRNY